MTDNNDLQEGDEPDSKATPAELLIEMRAGNTDAAYELLGRQASVKAWREALGYLAKTADHADLELAAHRALRRPPDVVSALIDLARAVASPQAAFVARAISKLRPEPHLIARANELKEQLLTKEVDPVLAADDGLGALYLILAHDLAQQPAMVKTVSTDAKAAKMLSDALDTEYQRLLELGRTVRWTSGSYRYLLRHSLAHLALLSSAHGRTGQLAYRLLQQQIETPEENDELLDLLPQETRRTFLLWALERENATSYSTRTRFVLAVARRHPSDVDRAVVVAAARAVTDPETVADALLTAVELGPAETDLDRDIADRLDDLPTDVARRLLRGVLVIEPKRVRADMLSAAARDLVVDSSDDAGDNVVREIASVLPRLVDVEKARELVEMAEKIAAKAWVGDESFEVIARALAARANQDARWEHALLTNFVVGPRTRAGMWTALAEAVPERRSSYVGRLIELDDPETNSRHASDLLLTDEVDEGAIDVLAVAVLDGAIFPRRLEGVTPAHIEQLAAAAATRASALQRQAAEAAALLQSGEPAAEAKLLEGLRPIIERAIDRAAGNERLQDDYRRLLSTTAETRQQTELGISEDIPASIIEELSKLGATIERSEAGPIIRLNEPNDTQKNVRYLAALDQRLAKSSPATRQAPAAVIEPYVLALGRVGDATAITIDLFERGPLMRVALGLTSNTRELVVKAALGNGLEVAPAWLEDVRLGNWLAGVIGAEEMQPSSERGESSPIAILESAHRTAETARAMQQRVERLQSDVKKSFVESALPAFVDLELAIDGYIQLWQALSQLGVSQVAPLGTVVAREEIDPDRHDIVSSSPAERYVVRAAGVAVDSQILVRARLEADDR